MIKMSKFFVNILFKLFKLLIKNINNISKLKLIKLLTIITVLVLVKKINDNLKIMPPIKRIGDSFLLPSKCNYGRNGPKVYCAIITNFNNLATKAMSVNNTWGIFFNFIIGILRIQTLFI